MKQFFLFLVLTVLYAGCNNVPADIRTLTKPDNSDLSMSDDLREVYSERRKLLLEKAGEGIIVLSSVLLFMR